ncbi:Endolytic murein transglycosylase [subsurface metagenome]
MSEHVWLKRVIYFLLIALLIAGIKGFSLYRKAFAPNIFTKDKKEVYLYIPTGSTYKDVLELIRTENLIRNTQSFEWAATKKNYPNNIHPGRYKVKNRMSNNEFINILRSGKQDPVLLTFNNLRTEKQLANRLAEQLEIDSPDIMKYFQSDSICEEYGFDKYTFKCIFIPNTYKVYWNISVDGLFDRMLSEYDAFWNKKRDRKVEEIGMTKEEVITLASIVNEETRKDDEKRRIAGVYMNRLNKGIRLHADPTVIYATGDFSMKRVLRKHYRINSPFNTYKYAGLPPGPICFPEISSIDAVLKYEKHKYLYFCAKPDFSGYHNFAKTLKEHNRNAELYRRELNKRRIYR